ncbi:MAG TPA: hypothetical protein VFQ40_05215 [Actinomycetota bacterium]|nr:hypothetical protein [Actinomycetota bacterium]
MLRRIVPLAVVIAVGVSCSLPALDTADFRSKAAAAAEDAISQANSAILATRLRDRERLPAATVTVLLEDVERAALAAVDGFASVLPPDERSDRIRAEVLPILEDVADLLARMRFAARRGDAVALEDLRSSLRGRVAALERWLDAG